MKSTKKKSLPLSGWIWIANITVAIILMVWFVIIIAALYIQLIVYLSRYIEFYKFYRIFAIIDVFFYDSRHKQAPTKLIANSNVIKTKKSDSLIISKPTLQWPPVLTDLTIPIQDGFDLMPYSGLKVPKFWKPAEGQDLFTSGDLINGVETIFLMIASYRDFQCRETIASAFAKADHPERLYVGAVDQVVPGDTGCLDLVIPCTADDKRPICIYKDRISIFKMDASTAT